MNLLGSKLYDPAAAVSKATSSLLGLTAIDTTNLRLTVTVPASGMLRFHLRGIVTGATTVPTILIGVLNGATVIGRVSPTYENATANAATQNFAFDADFTVTGLTPGSTAFDAAYAVQVVVASTNIKYGGPNNASGANAWGGFLFEIWDPQPMQTNAQLVIDANGRVDVSKIAGTAQTAGDVFARIGAPAGASVSADIASIKTDTGTTIPGRLPTALGANGNIKADVRDLLGTAWLTPGVAGTPDVNAKQIGATAQTGRDIGGTLGAAGAGLTAIGDTRLGNLDATVSSRLAPGGTLATVTTLTNLPAITANWLTAAGIAASALNGKGDWNIGKTGYALSAAGIQAIWDALTSALTTVGSIGKLLVTNIDALISSRSTYAGGAVASVTGNVGGNVVGSVGSVTGAVGSVTGNVGGSVASVTAGVTVTTNNDKSGYSLSTAGILAIWHQLTSAIVTAGTIGKLIVDYLDAAISSRSTYAGADTAGTTTLLSRLTAARAGYLDTLNGIVATIWAAVVDSSGVMTLLTRLSSTRAGNLDNLDVATSTRLASASYSAPPSATAIRSEIDANSTKLDVATSTRLASAGYTAPDNADILLIKAKTDNLPAAPAATGDIPSASTIAAAVWGYVTRTLSAFGFTVDTNANATETAIKAKTDSITFTKAGEIDANVQSVNDTTVTGDGNTGSEWGPA